MDQFTEDQRTYFKEVFSSFDKTENGTINTKDINAVLSSIGYSPPEAKLAEILQEIDYHQKQVLDFLDFLYIMARIHNYFDSLPEVEEPLIEAFRIFDRDGSGQILIAELMHVMHNLGEDNDDEIQEMIRKAGGEKEGRVNVESFYEVMMAKTKE